jgi:hypothetical protein
VHSVDELLAHKPDALLPDLVDVEKVLAAFDAL